MSEISPIGPPPGGPAARATPNGQPAREVPLETGHPNTRLTDTVQLSERVRSLDYLSELPAVRSELVDQLRVAISSGEYPGQDHLDFAIDRLINDLQK